MNRWKWILVALAIVIAVLVVVKAAIELSKHDMQPINLRYLSGVEAADLLVGQIPPQAIEGWAEKMVFVRASRADRAKAAEILSREDKPKPQVALRFQIIEADGFTGRDTTIARVESVLRSLFRFQGYRLVNEAFVRSKEKSESSQVLMSTDGVPYRLSVTIGEVLRRQEKASAEVSVSLRDGRLPSSGQQGLLLATTVNLPDGQTAVLGTARPDPARGALILVVTPEIR
jgi:hypothetical protein